jgi:hypothetical protein
MSGGKTAIPPTTFDEIVVKTPIAPAATLQQSAIPMRIREKRWLATALLSA